eukprot:2095804-Prymnesium_polylepis.1
MIVLMCAIEGHAHTRAAQRRCWFGFSASSAHLEPTSASARAPLGLRKAPSAFPAIAPGSRRGSPPARIARLRARATASPCSWSSPLRINRGARSSFLCAGGAL